MVRPCILKYLEIRSSLFSETLQLVRTQKGGKKFPSAFLKKNLVSPILAKNRVATFLENLGNLENTWNFKMTLENLENLENEAKILEKLGNLILIRKNI